MEPGGSPDLAGIVFNSRQESRNFRAAMKDIVAIKSSTGEIRTFCMGVGGEEMDYNFTYGDNIPD